MYKNIHLYTDIQVLIRIVYTILYDIFIHFIRLSSSIFIRLHMFSSELFDTIQNVTTGFIALLYTPLHISQHCVYQILF